MAEGWTVKIDGQELELPDDVCSTDKRLRDALVQFYPGAANSDVKRDEKARTITVTKRAGQKGACDRVAAALDRAPETFTPALVLDVLGAPRSKAALEAAVRESFEDESAVTRIVAALDDAPPSPSLAVPEGF